MTPTQTYLGSDAYGDFYMDGFFDSIGNFAKKIVHKPYESFIKATMVVGTGGLYYALPKNIQKKAVEIGKVAVPVVAGGALAVAYGPSIWNTLSSKFSAASKITSGTGDYGSNVIGSALKTGATKATSTDWLTMGGKFMDLLGKLPQNKQQQMAQAVTPEELAYIERYGALPPRLKAMQEQMERDSYQYAYEQSQRAAQSPSAYGLAPFPEGPAVAQAGMFDFSNPMTLALWAGGGVAVMLLFGKK